MKPPDQADTTKHAGAAFTARRALLALACLIAGQLFFARLNPFGPPWPAASGAALHLLAFLIVPIAPPPPGVDRPLGRRAVVALAIGLAAGAGLLRALWLDTLPWRLDGDTSAFAWAAADHMRPDPPPLLSTAWMGHTNIFLYVESLFLRVFGITIAGTRAFSAWGGTLAVPAVFLLGRELFGGRAGALAALVTALLPIHLVFSRVGTEVIHLTWLVPLTILCLLLGWRGRSWGWLLLGGALAGASQYVYPGARLVPLLCAALIGLLTLFPPDGVRSWRRCLGALAVVALGFALVYAPMLPYFLAYPENYLARVSSVNIFSSGWLAQQVARRPWHEVLADQLFACYLPFVYPVKGARLWYVWPQYLGPIDAALFLFGLLGLVFAGPRWLRLFFLFYLGVGMLLAGVLTTSSPMPSRYVIFLPVVALLIGYGLDIGARYVARAVMASGRALRLAGAAALGLYAAANLAAYVQHDTVAVWSEYPRDGFITAVTRDLLARPGEQRAIVFLRTELDYFEAYPTLRLLIGPNGANVEQSASCDQLLAFLPPGEVALVAPEPRVDELHDLIGRLPGSNLELFHSPQGELLGGTLYAHVPAGGLSRQPC